MKRVYLNSMNKKQRERLKWRKCANNLAGSLIEILLYIETVNFIRLFNDPAFRIAIDNGKIIIGTEKELKGMDVEIEKEKKSAYLNAMNEKQRKRLNWHTYVNNPCDSLIEILVHVETAEFIRLFNDPEFKIGLDYGKVIIGTKEELEDMDAEIEE